MNGIIVYGSFYGTTETLSRRIADAIGIKSMKIDTITRSEIELSDFIIVGSAVEKFRLHPDVADFFTKYSDLLSNKSLFLFISSYNPSIIKKLIETLPDSVKPKIIESIALGGKIIWEKLSLKDKIVISIISFITKQKLKGFDSINEKRINKFIEKIETFIKT